MDSSTLVDRRIDDGQRLLLQLARDGFEVLAAFWLKESDEDWWQLCLVAKGVEEQGLAPGYRAVQAALRKLPGTDLSLADVKLLDASEPLAQDVVKIQKHHPEPQPKHLVGGQLGDVSVTEVWLYPPLPKKRSPYVLGQRRLLSDVERTTTLDEHLAPLTSEERQALGQIVASGVSPDQAEYWIRKKRELNRARSVIPAGSVVTARVAAWWGDRPQDDPNPLLEVEAEDGARGLTFQDNTEPV